MFDVDNYIEREKGAIGEGNSKIKIKLGENKIYHRLYKLKKKMKIDETMEAIEQIVADLQNPIHGDDYFDDDGNPKYSYQAVIHFELKGWRSGTITNVYQHSTVELSYWLDEYGQEVAEVVGVETSNIDVPFIEDYVDRIMINMYPYDSRYG